MKRLFAIALAAGLAANLFAVDLGGDFVMTNMGFPWPQTQAVPAGTSFPATNFTYGGAASVSQQISDMLSLDTTYALDPLRRSVFQAMVNYDTGVLHIGIGPSFGLFDNLDYPMKAGFASSVRFEIPGAVFLSFRNDSSIGPSLGSIGENSQGFNQISVGWYVKNAICTARMTSEYFQVQQTSDLVTSDSSTDYSFMVDIFKKNQPYNIMLSMGYRTVSKEYVAAGASVKDSLGFIILGTEIVLRPVRFLEFDLGLDSSVYTFGFDGLLSRGPDLSTSYLFKAKAGLKIKTDKIDSTSGIVIKKAEAADGKAPEEKADDAPKPGTAATAPGTDAKTGDGNVDGGDASANGAEGTK
jgi:hypothetical protein